MTLRLFILSRYLGLKAKLNELLYRAMVGDLNY